MFFPVSDIVGKCYHRFTHPDIVTLTKAGTYHVMELWHGPTGSFKDLALSPMGCLMDHFLRKRGQKAVALVGTSGDTGSAAIQSVAHTDNVRIVVLYPQGRVSELQRRQMTTISSPNVKVFGCEGTSDDLDVPIRKVFADTSFVAKHNVLGLNSLNVARVLIQAAHYIYSYLQLSPTVDNNIHFVVPTGALGNVTGGYIARSMGLPIRFTAAVNENDIVHRSFSLGQLKLSEEVMKTHSCAMDIQYPYNIERLLYFLSDGDTDLVRSIMKQVDEQSSSVIPASLLQKNDCIQTTVVQQNEATSAAGMFWNEHQYTLCPHTAVGVAAANKIAAGSDDNVICVATATLAKFPEFAKLIGSPCPSHSGLKGIAEKPEYDKTMSAADDWEALLRTAITDF